MITKIATHKEPELIEFLNPWHEADYWDAICSICHDKSCEEDCMILIPGFEDCEDCTGTGRVWFRMVPQGRPQYNLITVCGICEGVGTV